MVKVKLIENDDYYDLHGRKYLILQVLWLVPVLIAGLVATRVPDNAWVWGVGALISAGGFVQVWQLRRRADRATGDRVLQLYTDRIEVVDAATGAVGARFPTAELAQVHLRVGNNVTEETFEKYRAVLSGKMPDNRLRFEHRGTAYDYNFVVDSFYLQKKLTEVADAWGSRPARGVRTSSGA